MLYLSLITYLFGYVPDMEFICKLCNKYNVPLVEDISQNIGSKYKGKLLGKFGFASFYSASLTKYVDGYNGAFILLNSKNLRLHKTVVSNYLITSHFKVF